MTRLFAPGDDVGALAAVHAASFPDAWTPQALADLLATPGTFVFHQSDGFVMARVAGDEAEILTIAVVPGARGRGVATALLAAAAAHALGVGGQSLFLEVGVENAPARALYARAGFAPVGQRKGYYDGKDALVLRAALPLSPVAKFA
jgi:ribosomal-protein-alanine N-acetyltransferase